MVHAWRRPVRASLQVVGLCAAFLAVAAGPALAQQSGDLYVVTGVPVDATGASAAEARDIALAQGPAKAAGEMLRRLTLYGDWPMLPEVDPATAETLVSGVGVSNERSSDTRYLADMTVRFQPAAVRGFLRSAGVRFTDNQAAPALVLPVLDTPGVRVLFDDPNPWRAAWDALDLGNSLVPLVMPLGDLQDLSAIDASSALTAEWADVEPLATRYGVDQVLVAHAVGGAGAGLDVALRRITPGGIDTIARSYDGATVEEAVTVAAEGIRDALIASWKAENAVTFGLEQTVPASVEFASLSEWLAIRERLAAASIVQDVDVIAVSPTGAQIEMRVAGPVESLASSLGQRQLRFVQEDEYWTLTIGAAARPAPLLDSGSEPGGIGFPDAGMAPAPAPTSPAALPEDEATADRLTRQQQRAPAP